MPASSNNAISSSLIGREALLMSVSPAMNFSNPPPVPDTPIVALTSGFAIENSSATASMIGNTVEDPSTKISLLAVALSVAAPLSVVASPPSPLPQAANVAPIVKAIANLDNLPKFIFSHPLC
ncbi:hypothetical protein SDC9_140798 [bioreactor metagenome]|uniref:Uncharacterized protein n=1 Tax=bioreactor metagenome TaxID=1076179 RepID=A0A645DX06_9ZZZZ